MSGIEVALFVGLVALVLFAAVLDAAETSGAWASADTMSYDDVIDPRELRNALLAALRVTRGRDAEPAAPARHAGIRP